MLLHLTTDLLLSLPPVVPAEAPPGGTAILKIGGWIMFCLGIACVVGIAKAGALIGVSGSGHGGQSGSHVIGFIASCLGALICFGAWGIAAVMV